MTYPLPPLVGDFTVNTNAAPNTNTNSVVIAAPGVNKALRIAVIRIAGIPSNTGNIRAQFFDSLGLNNLGHMQFPVGAHDDQTFPEPGIQLSNNAALSVTHSSNIATQNIRISIYYYIDDVT
jgi:hypothetical protein